MHILHIYSQTLNLKMENYTPTNRDWEDGKRM